MSKNNTYRNKKQKYLPTPRGLKYKQAIPRLLFDKLPGISDQLTDKIEGYSFDRLCEVINTIAVNVRIENEPAPINAKYLRRLVPRGDDYLRELVELGVIDRLGNYEPGIHSYKYEFSPQYRSEYTTRILKDQRLINRIHSTWEQIKKQQPRRRMEQVRDIKKLELRPDWREYVEHNFKNNMDVYNSVMGTGIRIENGDFFYNVDNTSGRFHSNVTSLKKEIRQFLTVKGEPLVNIDIKNSQPYLSTILLTAPGKASKLAGTGVFYQLLDALEASDAKDTKLYLELVSKGRIYEHLQAKFKDAGIYQTRDEAKARMFNILFAPNGMPPAEIKNATTTELKGRERERKIIRACRQVFALEFPTVNKIFSMVRGNKRTGDHNENYKRFAILLQRIEAYLMLDVIVKRIHREYPDIICITVHDSIMTGVHTDNVIAVAGIMYQELKNFTKIAPEIKIEYPEQRKYENKETNELFATTVN